MCGIVGQMRLVPGPALSADRVQRMADAVRHRGPDDSGIHADPLGRCVLGHRRLSVIDLACGHQPLANEDGTVWTAFNGEIYNFQELKSSLEAAGHRFRTHSDTEVLVHLWEQHGPQMLDHLRGMFAFAIWDTRTETLFLARDPLGKKPLYYTQNAGVLFFSSELKGILADKAVPREVDRQSLLMYLTFGYVPHPGSILKNVIKLPPGHSLLARNGQVDVQRYWRVPHGATFDGTFSDGSRQLRELMSNAVRRRLIADVSLGAFLSGGIDSTIVVGLMSQQMAQPVKTFTIGFDESSHDESAFARIVAKRFRTDHHELIVRPDALEVLPTLAHHFDEPFADSSAIPTYYVSKMARQHVTVALTGDAGDEMFGGYRRYRVGKTLGMMQHLPGASILLQGAAKVTPRGDRTTNLGRIRRMLDGIRSGPRGAYFAQVTQFDPQTLGELLSPEFLASIDAALPQKWFESLYPGGESLDPARDDMAADIESYLPCDILTKVDIASMAVALECRSPFLDRDVVEFACRLPTRWRLRGLFQHKYILKQTFADLIPDEIMRRRKSGFAVPLAAWFRGPLKSMLSDLLLDPTARSRGYFQPAAIQRLIDEHQSGLRNHSSPLWLLLMLELWHRSWLDSPPISG